MLRTASRSSIEPLEQRIAPALLVNGANLLGGAGNPSTGETSVGDNSVTLVKVTSGQALVWFDNGHIQSISFGPNTGLEVKGDIFGDVVGNLNADGTLSDSDNDPTNGEDGGKLLANNLVHLKTTPLSSEDGSIGNGLTGNIITGGSVSGLSISGEVLGVYAGDGAFRAESGIFIGGVVTSSVGSLDINPVTSGTQSTFTFTKAGSAFLPGASIKSSSITRAPGLQLFAGSGNPSGATIAGAGVAGGSIVGITVDSAIVPSGSLINTPSYWLIAGDGAGGKSGGAGGSIANIIEKTSFGPVVLTAGHGGAGTGGAGGAGGSISSLDVQSNSAHYILTAGRGGNGAPGGAGGQVVSNNFTNRTPVSGIVVGGDFTGDGIDDVLVVDAATGQMIISTQDDPNPKDNLSYTNNGTFNQLVQFKNQANDNVVLIDPDPSGVSPSDAAAVDVNGDGKLDIIVAYKNSSNLAVFLNQGKGVFYDPNQGTTGGFATASLGLSFAPAKILVNNGLIIAENTDGKGILHYAQVSGSSVDTLTLDVSTGSNEFSRPVADLVAGNGEVIVGFTDGVISRLQTLGIDAKKPFLVSDSGITIPGGITDLEVDSTGNRLLALSKTAHTVDVIDISGSSYVRLATIALAASADPLVAHFVHDKDAATEDAFTVLGLLPSGSIVSTYTQAADDGDPTTVESFSPSASLRTSNVLKNFTPLYGPLGFVGDAALAGSNNSFTFTADLLSTKDYPLPFASKIVEATAGAGGNGLDLNLGKLIGKGGAGGIINGINVDANEIHLTAGAGGASVTGAAGAGGSVQNPATFTTVSGTLVTPKLLADVVLDITAGSGGTPASAGKTASGGAGGSLSGLNIILDAGDITLSTGRGGDGRGANAGAGGNFLNVTTFGKDGNLTITTGRGGDALGTLGAGGAGGSVVNFSHELALDPNVELLEKKYSVTIGTGAGGNAGGGVGGAGGIVNVATLRLDGSDRTYDDSSVTPPLVNSHKDNTVRIKVSTGIGGQGTTGGAGGIIRSLATTSVFDQTERDGSILINYVAGQITAGAGGAGTAGAGGAGGSINFGHPISGITSYDPDATDPADPAGKVPFIARAGAGGNGSTKGGAGGAVTGLTLQNSAFADGKSITQTQLRAAMITAGSGGNGGTMEGGAGGAVSGATIGTQGGNLFILAGNGGNGGTKGGVGGAVAASTFGVVSTVADLGLSVRAGNGGTGALGGGFGGALSSLQISTPQSTNGISAVLHSGDGGAATTNKGVGGKGGDVLGINQLKDINSSINLIQAGNGGANSGGTGGIGGAGGNVTGIKTVGFVGRPSDGTNRLGVFDKIGTGSSAVEIAQGLFSGRGGSGAIVGVNGAITSVTARQIAAIAAAVDASGHFAAASKITTVKAAVIGFDIDRDATFDSTVPGTPNPKVSKAIDGFIFGTFITGVTTLPGASFVFNA